MADTTKRRTRYWADVIAIIASVTALGNAMWGALIFSHLSSSVTTDQGVGYNWFAFGIGGLLGVLGLIVAQVRPMPGRLALAVGGAFLVAVPFFYENKPLLPIATSVVLGIALLASSAFLGPMPRPRQNVEQVSR
jgi:hypothetical protein